MFLLRHGVGFSSPASCPTVAPPCHPQRLSRPHQQSLCPRGRIPLPSVSQEGCAFRASYVLLRVIPLFTACFGTKLFLSGGIPCPCGDDHFLSNSLTFLVAAGYAANFFLKNLPCFEFYGLRAIQGEFHELPTAANPCPQIRSRVSLNLRAHHGPSGGYQ